MSAVVPVPGRAFRPGATTWSRDLRELREGRLGFDAFARRHRGVVAKIAAPWARRTMGRLCRQDVEQEILLVVWQAITDWEPSRGFGLDASGYVRMRVRHHLQKLVTRRHSRAVEVDTEFWGGLEESRGAMRSDDPLAAAEAAERAAAVFGGVAGPDRDALVAALLRGAPRGPGREGEQHRFARAVRRAVAIAAEHDAAV